MELKKFITESLNQICDGIKDANQPSSIAPIYVPGAPKEYDGNQRIAYNYEGEKTHFD